MAVYASRDDLAAWVIDNPDVTLSGDPEAQERLLERAERAVDLALGPYERDPDTGLKLDPAALTDVQRDALARATCAAVEHELLVGLPLLAGDEDYAPEGVQVVHRPALVSPRMLRELAGHGLLKRSGTVLTPAETPAA